MKKREQRARIADRVQLAYIQLKKAKPFATFDDVADAMEWKYSTTTVYSAVNKPMKLSTKALETVAETLEGMI